MSCRPQMCDLGRIITLADCFEVKCSHHCWMILYFFFFSVAQLVTFTAYFPKNTKLSACFNLLQAKAKGFTAISFKITLAPVSLPYTSILLQSCFYSALSFQTSPHCSALKFPSQTCSGHS